MEDCNWLVTWLYERSLQLILIQTCIQVDNEILGCQYVLRHVEVYLNLRLSCGWHMLACIRCMLTWAFHIYCISRDVQDGLVQGRQLTWHTCLIVKTTYIDHRHLIFCSGHPIVFVCWSGASIMGLEHLMTKLNQEWLSTHLMWLPRLIEYPHGVKTYWVLFLWCHQSCLVSHATSHMHVAVCAWHMPCTSQQSSSFLHFMVHVKSACQRVHDACKHVSSTSLMCISTCLRSYLGQFSLWQPPLIRN